MFLFARHAQKETYEGREKWRQQLYSVLLASSWPFNPLGKLQILQIKTHCNKRKCTESFYINSLSNVLNDKKSICFSFVHQNSCAIVDYFDSFVLLIVSRDLVLSQ